VKRKKIIRPGAFIDTRRHTASQCEEFIGLLHSAGCLNATTDNGLLYNGLGRRKFSHFVGWIEGGLVSGAVGTNFPSLFLNFSDARQIEWPFPGIHDEPMPLHKLIARTCAAASIFLLIAFSVAFGISGVTG